MNKKTNEIPNESGYYHHMNAHGEEEIVLLEMRHGLWHVYKVSGESYFLNKDKGKFGARILLPSEEE